MCYSCAVMQKTAQDTQPQIGNPDTARRIYAFATARINPDWISLKVWLLGGVIRARNIAVAALPDLIAQIDAALADGCEVIALDGAEFSAPEKVLSGIRKEFSSYCCIGGVSDAKNVPVKLSSDSAESVKKCGAKTKASAPQGNTSVARQISVEEPISHPRFPRNYVRRNSKIAKITAESIGSALREELEPVLDALDDIGAMLSELLSEREIDHAPKQPRGWRKCTVENPLGGVIRTKCGRTSVVVGTRKISKTTTRK